MSKKKMLLIAAIFSAVVFLVPLFILIAFVSTDYLYIYVIVFGFLFFFSIGSLFAIILSVKKDLLDTVEELKIQNAAIAFRLAELKKGIMEPSDDIMNPVLPVEKPAEAAPVAMGAGSASDGVPISKKKFDDFGG